MRFDVVALAVLGLGGLALTAAADPAPTKPPAPAAAPAAVVSDSAPKPTSAATGMPALPAASSTAASPPAAAVKVDAAPLSGAEQRLINLGYKPQMRNGEKIYCRREAALGSRISAGQHCGTVAQLAGESQSGKDYLQKTQQSQLNPMGN